MDGDPIRGIRNGLLISAPLWAFLILGAIALAGCSARHDDGMGDLWKGVKHCAEGGCK
ncbi:MAG TPA: hypothetical protein VIU82_25985 [Bosea sp. (in: a-proteobacteria)]